MTVDELHGEASRKVRARASGQPSGQAVQPRNKAVPPQKRRRRGRSPAPALLGALLISLGLGAGALGALVFDGGPPEPLRAPARPAAPVAVPLETPLRPAPPVSPDALWIRNAVPFGPDPRPSLAVILVDQGRDPSLSAAAMRLTGPLNIAVGAHLENLDLRLSGVRRGGHEGLVALPFDRDPPGVLAGGALMSNLPLDENLRRLRTRLGQAPSAVGVLGVGGEQATRDLRLMEAAMSEIRKAGALFIDSRAHPESLAGAAARRMGAPAGDVALRFDEGSGVESMVGRLEEAEGRATVWGTAIAMAELTPQSLEALRLWLAERGAAGSAPVALAPASAVIKRLRSAAPDPAHEP
ncbi:divergent polysaccharide deacetylase family protein [Neomegalonema sp.]|uniref:divergent polysaccharide deacetylase family protein n=1 Tax=Neomegalonema sp. TaxID=2039713 RepID=UPI00260FEEC3|nr:divergent polysaccharide deacetylase family protein [Neomegalonema sp.]MDD2869717.1 divergent polysaccharide deacetylase family protein [Neomegalonema sp.]